MNSRTDQIRAALAGRKAAAVNDSAMMDAVRFKLESLSGVKGTILTRTAVRGIAAAVCRAAARTVLYEAEVPVALEMGAAGELDLPDTVNQTNAASWITAYAVCPDRSAAVHADRIDAFRDRARTDGAVNEEARQDFCRAGLYRAWCAFVAEGAWTFREGYGAALYDRIGRDAIGAVLSAEIRNRARAAALATVRRDSSRLSRTASDSDVQADDLFPMHYKAHLARAYFEELRARGLEIPNPDEI